MICGYWLSQIQLEKLNPKPNTTHLAQESGKIKMWVALHFLCLLMSKTNHLIRDSCSRESNLSYNRAYSLMFSCLIVVSIAHISKCSYNPSHPENSSPYCYLKLFLTAFQLIISNQNPPICYSFHPLLICFMPFSIIYIPIFSYIMIIVIH